MGTMLLLFSLNLQAETTLPEQSTSKPQTPFHNLSYWQQLYGDSLEFNVTRNDKPVGQYQVAFKGTDQSWRVESRMALDFKAFLFFPYRFRYLGVEHWQNDQMTHFTSRIDRNGELSETFLQRSQDTSGLPFWRGGLRQSPKGKPANESVKPLTNGSQNLALSNHYNYGIIQQSQLFNSLTGALNQIQLKKEDLERISDGREKVLTTRYRYTGDLKDTWVWYTHDQRWLRMRFIADDGSTIQLNCQRCYPD
ncbi:DUF6134 family protein [Oceanospirillum sp.]|uniref:DUF6134 family protein n=1 Tax=Oceanospirillum sp. TaxID=2021254 RepID=UPI003A8E1366